MEKGRGGQGILLLCTNFPEFIYSPVPCTPYLNQVFHLCFSMDNLRAYVEDGSQSPSVQEQLAKRPNPSTGLSTSSSTSSASSTALSTRAPSGPVPEVSAPTPSPSTVPRDKTVSLEDLPPPPPPSEPYELFLARVACQMTSLPGGPPRPAAAGPAQPPKPLPTAGSRLPMPFPRFVDTSWATHPQVQVPRIRMPLPSSCYAPPPSPWTWPGRGPAVTTLQVRGPAPLTSSTGPIRLPGPATLAGGPPATGPLPPLPPTTSSSELKNTVSTPPRFRGFFPGATPPLVPMASTTSTTVTALSTTPQTDGNVSLGPTQEMVQDWKAQFFEDMRLYWQQLQGDAPPQSTVGPAVPQGNMGSDTLRQLSPSGDREASRAQHKSGTKWEGSDSRHHNSSRERSSGDRAWRRDRRSQTSPDSSPRRHRSTTAKRSRLDCARSNDSSSSEGQQRSQRPHRPWTSRSQGHWRRDSSPSPSPPRRYRSSPAPSRRSFGAGMTKRPAGRPSPSPPRRSSSHHRQSLHPSRDCSSPHPSRSRGPHHHHISSSSSRSPSPKRPRTESMSHSLRASRSVSRERGQHPYDTDIRLLRLRADTDDDRYPPSTHPRGSPEPDPSLVKDDALSAAKVQKLFADLAAPPALSHYADPIPDSTANKQLVPYARQSTTASSSSVKNNEPLETHGLFKNYQSFHRLSADSEKEACTAAYHDLTTLMLSQTDEPQLINVSSTRPKMDEPYPHGAVSSNEMKKKHERLILQWPPQSSHKKVIDRTLGLYQHGPPP